MMASRSAARPSQRSFVGLALLLGAFASGCSDDAAADSEDVDAPACVGKCDGFGSVTGDLPLTVHAATWDGRVMVADVGGECRVVAVRPEHIELREAGGVGFGPNVFSEGQACPSTLATPAIAKAQGRDHNPYPSDAAGTLAWDGGHLTYAMTMIDTDASGALVRREGQVVVTDVEGESEVISATWGEPTQLGLDGNRPSLTANAELLVFEREDTLWFSTGDFSTAAPLSELHTHASDIVDGVPLGDRAPLSLGALRTADGTEIATGDSFVGSRPWISQDGSEIFFETEGGTMVLGERTGFAVRHLDGHINERSDGAAAYHLGLGRSGSAFAPYPGAHRLPVRDHRLPAIPMVGFVERDEGYDSTYDEVDFAAFSDQDYVVYLPTNALTARDGSLETTRLGDISGHFNSAVLEGDAAFAAGSLPSAHGEFVTLSGGGRIRIPASETTAAPPQGLNVSMFVRPIAGTISGRLLDWPGVMTVDVSPEGVTATVTTTDGLRSSSNLRPLELDTWTHVSISYDGNSGTLRVYFDGLRVSNDREGRGAPPVQGEPTDIIIGDVQADRTGPIAGIDEITISRISRFDDEVFAEARREELWRRPPAQVEDFTDDIEFPLGVDPAEFIMPGRSDVEPATVELGMLLFFDNRLSSNGEVSCATCHDPEIAFTDGRALGPNINGGNLSRATPTIFNRGLSTAQFWDGRTGSVESQALQPIFSAAEMGFSRAEALALVNSSPEYVDRFNDVFGRDPSLGTMAAAIAAFERAQLTGDSPVDRFEAGETTALTDSEARGRALFWGKARCVACHSGSNYADEELHDIGLLDDNDQGATRIRRGRTRNFRAFKTPTLRNIDVTGPYFHNGSVETLEEVVALYNAGPIRDADSESRALGLSADEQTDLVAFLRALTSPNAVQTFDVELPEIE